MFSLNQARVVEICEEILRRGLKVQWKCETRVDCLDQATIEIMARAGCTGINFGVESTDPEIQQGVHRKPILKPEFVDKVELCRKHHIATFAFFVVGLPGDTVETILQSIEFAVEIRANWTQFTVATPFAGTPMHDWAVRQGLIAPDFYKIISAHDGSPGNEHLRPRDIVRLYRFARFLQDNLINRRGILKNETPAGPGLSRRHGAPPTWSPTQPPQCWSGPDGSTSLERSRSCRRRRPGLAATRVVPLAWRRSTPSMTASAAIGQSWSAGTEMVPPRPATPDADASRRSPPRPRADVPCELSVVVPSVGGWQDCRAASTRWLPTRRT